MRLQDAMTALATGDATVVDVTNLASDDKSDRAAGTDDDYERQVALG